MMLVMRRRPYDPDLEQAREETSAALEKAEVEAGFVLTCQCRPLTPRVVLSFDER